MALNENRIKEKWSDIKSDLKKSWSKLKDDDLEKTKGNVVAVQILLEKNYGGKKETYLQKVNDIYSRYEVKKNEKINTGKNNLSA